MMTLSWISAALAAGVASAATCAVDRATADLALLQRGTRVARSTLGTESDLSQTCYSELAAVAADEGEAVASLSGTKSACQDRCTANDQCKSFAVSPIWGCYLEAKSFTGDEATRTNGDFKIYYKKPCAQTPAAPASTHPVSEAASIKVASYNLYWWNAFGQNPWKGDQIINNIKDTMKPDLLGVQECNDANLIQHRTGYRLASPFADNQGVMVNPSLFSVGESGSRDLEARGKWGNRYVTWAHVTHKPSGRAFWAFNTHWCVHSGHGHTCGPDKRYVGAKNMLRTIQEKAGSAPVIITGDFNAGLHEEALQHFLRNGFSLAKMNWVDAVFYTTAHWQKGHTTTGSSAGSDHSPVIAELKLK